MPTAATTVFKGDFLITSTNGFQLNLVTATGTHQMNVFGDLTIAAGTLNIKTTTGTVNIFTYGNLNINTGATLTQSSTNTSTNINFAGINKSYNNAGTFNSFYINYVVRDTAIYTINSIIELGAARTLNINSGGKLILNADIVYLSGVPVTKVSAGGTLDLRGYLVRGVTTPIGTFALSAGGTLITDHPDGINLFVTGAIGSIRTATRTFTAGVNYVYTANAQNTGTAFGNTNILTGTFEGCNINLTSAVTSTSAGNVVRLDGAKLNLGNNNLTLSAANASIEAVQAFSGSNMIVTNGTGQLSLAIPATASLSNPYVFPIGTGNEYAPVSLNVSAAAARTIGARTIGTAHPNLGTPSAYLNRHWLFTNSSATGTFDYSATFEYADADIVGNEADILANVRQSGDWYSQTTDLDVANNSFTFPESGTLNHTTTGAALFNTEVTAFNSPANPFLNFRTVSNGNWSNPAIWEVSTDVTFANPAPIPATYYPTATTARNIRIVSDHQVTLDVDVIVDDLFINDVSTSSLTIPSARTLTLVTSAAADLTLTSIVPRLIVDGTFINQAAVTGAAVTNTFFNANSLYRHNRDGGVVPQATWDATATLLFDGFINTSPSTAIGAPAGGFGNITYEATSQTGNILLGLGTTTIKGNLNIISTGSAIVSLTNAGSTITIDGNLNLSGGNLSQIGFTSGTAVSILALNGNYNQTGGSYTARTGTGTVNQTMYFNIPSTAYNRSAGTFDATNLNYEVRAGAIFTNNNNLPLETARTFTINAGGEMNLNNNITVNGTGSFRNNGRLNTGSFIINGAGSYVQGTTLALASTAILSIGSVDGFNSVAASGNIQTTIRTINNPSNYIYESTVTTMGNGYTVAPIQTSMTFNGCTVTLPSALTAITMNLNNANVTLNANTSISGTTDALALNNSILTLGNNNLTLTNAAHNIAGTFANSNMIVTNGTGYLYRQIPATTSLINPYVFPVGSNGNYTPAVFNFTTTVTGSLGGRTIGNVHPNMGASSSYLERYWDFTIASGLATYTYSAELHYANADVFNDENEILANQWSGGNWNAIPSTIDVTDNILRFPSIGTLTQTALPINGGDLTGRNTLILYAYRTVASGDWSAPTTWEISTDPTFTNPAPIPATTYPTADNSILIRIYNGNEVNLDVNVNADQMEILSTVGSKLIIEPGVTMTIKDGSGIDFNILGANARLDVEGTLINEGQLNGSSVTTTNFFDGSLYEHKQDGGLVPISSWATNATLLFSSQVITNITPLGAPTGGFGHITYNSPLQTSDLNLGLSTVTIKGNLNIESTGSGKLALYAAAGTLTINGNLNQTGGDLAMIGYLSGTAATNLQLNGNFNQSLGSYRSIHGTGTGVQTITWLAGPNRTFTQAGSLFDMQGLTNITVNAGAELTLNNGINLGTPPSGTRTFTNNGTLWMGNHIIEGGTNTSFVNTSLATVTLGVGHPEGIALIADGNIGNIRTAARSYGVLANYVYNGSVAQVTGSGLHSAVLGTNTCTNLTINNAGGVTQQRLGSTALNIGVAGQLIITNGTYQIDGTIGEINTLALNGPAISPLASTSLLSNQYSNLFYGPSTANSNADLYIPSSISNLNELRINIQAINTVTQSSNISLHAPSSALTLTSGRLVITGTSNLTVLSTLTNAISTGSVNNMVVTAGSGQLRRAIPGGIAAATDYIFPVGDLTATAEYSPANLRFVSTSASPSFRLIGVNVVDEQHPNDFTASNHFTRYWAFTDSENGNGNYTYTGIGTGGVNMLTGLAIDVVGTYANIRLNRWDGSAWTQYNNIASTPNLSFAPQTEFTAPLHGSAFTGRVNAAQAYVWLPNDGLSHDFNNPLNWSPNRISTQVEDILLFNQGNSSTANEVPSQTVGQVFVSNNTNISFEAAALPAGIKTFTISGLASTVNYSIAAGSTFQLSGTTQINLTMTGNANQSANIAGVFNINDNGAQTNTLVTSGFASNVFTISGTLNNNGGIITSAASGNLIFDATGTYNHNRNGGNIPNSVAAPLATWNASSTCNITGITTTNPATFQGVFGNVNWDNSGQTSTGAISAIMTINGNLSVSNGLLWDAGVIINGNASGSFTVANGASYRTTRNTTLPLLPSFDGANVTLNPSSVVIYAGAAHNIPDNPTNSGTMTTYGILNIEGGVTKTMNTNISVQGLNILTSGGTLADNGFVITGPGIGSGTFSMANGTNLTLTNPALNPMPVFQTYNFDAGSRVNYYATANQNIASAPIYGTLATLNAGVKSLVGTTDVQTQVIALAASEFNLNGNRIRISGITPFANNAASIFTANTAGSTIELNSTTALQTLTIAGTITGGIIDNLVSSNTFYSGVSTTSGLLLGATPGPFNVNNVTVNTGAYLNLGVRTLQVNGLYSNAGTLIGNANNARISFTGSAAQNFTPGTLELGVLNCLTINNAAGVTLLSPLAITNNLTLTAGNLNTSNKNLITIQNTAATAITGGAATSYINGPLARWLPENLAGSNTYIFPVGKSTFREYRMINSTTNSGFGNVVIKAEVFDANAGGVAGVGLASLNTNRYWHVENTGTGTLNSVLRISLNETGLTVNNRIGQSSTLAGTYQIRGGAVLGDVISSADNAVSPSLGYFVIGEAGGDLCGFYTLGPGGFDFVSFTDVISILNTVNVTCDVVIEVKDTYVGAGESFPLNFTSLNYGIGGPFTVTFRPGAGVTATVQSAVIGNLVALNGVSNLIFDGRREGTGAPHHLIFNNTSTSTSTNVSTFSFLNDASNNIIRYCDISGSGSSAASGVVHFRTTTGSTGNDNNTISNNLIHNFTNAPANLIYAAGTASNDNDNNTITNNELYGNDGANTAAIRIGSNNHSYTISNNSIYQPNAISGVSNAYGIFIEAGTAANAGFNVTGNFIGGSSANAIGTWTVNSSGQNHRFSGINVVTATGNANAISNNTIRNFDITTGSGSTADFSVFSGIYAGNGLTNITNNIIGTTSSAANIIVRQTLNALGHVNGIFHNANNNVDISNNNIGGIEINNPASSANIMSLYGIRASSSGANAVINVNGNLVGSASQANSLINTSGNTYSGTGDIFTAGIHVNALRASNILNNTVANITYNAQGSATGVGANRTVGIHRQFSTGSNTILLNLVEANSVFNIRSSSPFSGTEVNSVVSGINFHVPTAVGQIMRTNTVHTIESTHASAAVHPSGIIVNTPASTATLQSIFTNNFSNSSQWTANIVTGTEGGSPNPFEIGTGSPYSGGCFGSATSTALYIRCTGFFCDLIGGGGPVYNATSSANNTDRSTHFNSNISTVGYTGVRVNFVYRSQGSANSYGNLRYSLDGGSTWIDDGLKLNGTSSWVCHTTILPPECSNNPNFRIGFRWRNNASGGDPPLAVTNVQVQGFALNDEFNIVERNFIHSINALSSSNSTTVTGLEIAGGVTVYQNNMIRVGIDAAGADINNDYIVSGITETAGSNDLYHNSVYVGGSNVTGTNHSYAYRNLVATGSRNVQNNIFFNERSNGAGSGSHYAVRYESTENVTSNYNLLRANGVGGLMFASGATNYPYLTYWQNETGTDVQSVLGDPLFISKNGNAATVDLHIQPAAVTPIESAGIVLPLVVNDFDNADRSLNTPSDIGAHAGNFTPIDLTPPSIIYTPISIQQLCAGNVNTTVQISVFDETGISLASNFPRMYIRRAVGSPTTSWSVASSLAGTFISGTSQSSIWEFDVDYVALGFTPVSEGEVLEYYFVAQDLASTPNVGFTQTNGSTPVHPNVSTLTTAPGFAFGASGFFNIGLPLGGTVYVGTGPGLPQYGSFNELFNEINTLGLNNDLEVLVQNNVTEPASALLNQVVDYCNNIDRSIIIKPVDANLYTIEGSTGITIDFNNVKNLTIDGSFAGTGRYLRFRNTNNTDRTIRLNNGSNNIAILNSVIEGNNGSEMIRLGEIGGEVHHITLDGNLIRNRSDLTQNATNRPYNGIRSTGTSPSNLNADITITNNEFFNFIQSGFIVLHNGDYNGSNWNISDNRFYNAITNTGNNVTSTIVFLPGASSHSNVISGNINGGSNSTNTGTWINAVNQFHRAISLNVGGADDTEATIVANNIIRNISMTGIGNGFSSFTGIHIEGAASRIKVQDNQIGDPAVANNITSSGDGNYVFFSQYDVTDIYAIWNKSSGNNVEITGNTIANITSTAAGGYANVGGIRSGQREYGGSGSWTTINAGKVLISNNTITGLRGTTAQSWEDIPAYPGGIFGIAVISNNANNEIRHNTIHNLFANGGWNRGVHVYGISADSPFGMTGGGEIEGNLVYDLRNNNTGWNASFRPEIAGIGIGNMITSGTFSITGTLGNGNYTVFNNQISLMPTSNNILSVVGLRDEIKTGNQSSYFNNSVYIAGGSTATGHFAYPFLHYPNRGNATTGGIVNVSNNILMINRTGGGNYRAIARVVNGTGTWNADYNFLSSLDMTNNTGNWQGTGYGLANWLTNSGGDANTTAATVINAGNSSATEVRPDELFVNPVNNLKIVETPPNPPWPYDFINDKGTPLVAVTVDFEGDARDLLNPDIGADEIVICLPVVIDTEPAPVQVVCLNGNVDLDVTISSGSTPITYQWQLFNGSTWDDLTNGGNYNDVTTASLEITGVTVGMHENQYRLLLNNACSSINSITITLEVQSPGQWIGITADWDNASNWGCGIIPTTTTNVVIPSVLEPGNVYPVVGSVSTSVCQNLTIQLGASVTVDPTNDLSVYGDFTNDGVASLGTGTIRFRGSSTQVVDGSTISEFGSVTIDNNVTPNPAVELNNDIMISGTLTFVEGKLHLNGSDIDLNGTGQLSGENNNHRAYGLTGEIKTVITLAASTNYANIAGLGVGINTGTTAPGVTNIERGHFQYTHLGSYQSIRRYFNVTPATNAALDATLRLYYFDDEMDVTVGPPPVKANLLPWRSIDNGLTWQGQFLPANLTNDIVNNWVELSGIPAFSRWTLSDWVNHPLPIQLLSFTATANYAEQAVDLQWITASEINNAFYTIERSANAQQFQPVLNRPGAGNSNTVINYTDVDINPLQGLSYYRLKQTDFNGTSSYSEIVPVIFSSTSLESVHSYMSDRSGLNIRYQSN